MTRLRLTAPAAVAAMVVTLVGGPLAGAQPRYQQPGYSQAPGNVYGQSQSYQLPAYTPPVQPQTSPYQVSSQPVGEYRVAQQQPLALQPPTTTTPSTPYTIPNYQAPAPGSRYATVKDSFTGVGAASLPTPPASLPPTVDQSITHATPKPSYTLPNYQAPAPGNRYALLQDDSAESVATESVPTPPAPVAEQDASNDSAEGTNGSWESDVRAPAVGAACDYNTGGYYDHACDYGGFGGASGHAVGDKLLTGCNNPCRQWFFGVYGLFMKRDNPDYKRFAFLVDSPTAFPYLPTQSLDSPLSTENIEPDWQWGAEVRLGSTCGAAGGPRHP